MKDWKAAIYVWRQRMGRFGLTLPMLSAFRVWLDGGDTSDMALLRKTGRSILAEMRRSNIISANGDVFYLNRFTCQTIRELVFGFWHRPKNKKYPASLLERYSWDGPSKVENEYGDWEWKSLSPWDIRAFKRFKRFLEKNK